MAEPVLEARGLSRSYLQGTQTVEVLRGIDLAVGAGEFLAILGPSGSGKSTLLHLLGLMDRPTTGEVFLRGRPADASDPKNASTLRGRHIGFVFQFDALMAEFSALENVLMPARIAAASGDRSAWDGAEERARTLLDAAGVLRHADRAPRELSGGERQRVSLARALMNRPSVVLADEPTGNLDRPNAELVFSKLRELAGSLGVAVVMVTHNESSVGYATRAAHLKDGRLAEGSEA